VIAALALALAAAAAGEALPLDGLAASQVGYGRGMEKRFTSPRPFGSFAVVRVADGVKVLEGGGPARTVTTEVLGPRREVWIGDFSRLAQPGRYRIVADNGLTSHPFDVGPDVFDRPLRAMQRFFYFQRAFTAVDPRHSEGPWTHPSDAGKAPPAVMKGWHDAGDLSIYNASMTAAVFWLLETFSDFAPKADDTNIPESGNGDPDLLDEARWGLEWFLSAQDPGSGGFRNTTCQANEGKYGTNLPHLVPPYRNGELGTIATARAVGILAYGAKVFRAHDMAFAQRCLEAARRGYSYLQARPDVNTDGPSCPSYRSNGDRVTGRHVRMFAAAGMLVATGERHFRDAFERSYEELTYIPDYHKMNGYAAMLYLRASAGDPARKRAIRDRVLALADAARADGAAHPFEWASHYYWGSISNGFHRAAFAARICLDEQRREYCEQALSSVHYALGRNSLRFVYVSGLPGVTRGMTRGFHEWLQSLDASPRDFPGMVAGGPVAAPDANDRSYPDAKPRPQWGYWGDPKNPRDASTPLDARHTDNDSWSTNEVAVNWQGAAVYMIHLAQRLARSVPPEPSPAAPQGASGKGGTVGAR
jgi:endoglucanase